MFKYYRFFHISAAILLFTAVSFVNPVQANGDIKGEIAIPDSNHFQIINLKDGTTLNGRIVEFNDTEVIFDCSVGRLTIQIGKIEEIKLAENTNIVKGRYYFPNPNSTRLFFAPTARMLKQGDGYFSDYYLFFPGFSYGFSSMFNFGGGLSIFPGLNLRDQFLYITPKIGVKASEKLNFAAGALIIKIPEFDDSGDTDGDNSDEISSIGILYGVGTIGSPDASLTFGMGYGYAGDNLADSPMFMIGGEARMSRRTAFVTENWIFPGSGHPLISYGMRFFGEKLCVDLAFITFLGEGAFFPGIPYIDFVVSF